MISRRAPGPASGRPAAVVATLRGGLVLALVGLGLLSVPPARAAIGPVGTGDPTVATEPAQNAGAFSPQRLGTRSAPHRFEFHNPSVTPISMGDVTLDGVRQSDPYGDDADKGRMAFTVTTDCPGAVLLPQGTCEVVVTFAPVRPGTNSASLRVAHDGDSRAFVQALQGDGTLGLYQAGAFGEVMFYGDAGLHGDLAHVAIASPVLGIATTPSGDGYWLMEASGRMHPFGDAPDLGSPGLPPDEYAIAVAVTPTGKGYWVATQAGAVHAMGDAGFLGSAAGTLGGEVTVVDLAVTSTGKGYWLVDNAGGVHAFGDAGFFGSAASLPPRYAVTGMAPTASGKGYWLVDVLGGTFAYGDAQAFPPDKTYSAYGTEYALNDAVITVRADPYGQGFAYGRLKGGLYANGVTVTLWAPSGGGGGLEQGSAAVDLAFNVPALHLSPGAGTVARTGQPGLRAPNQVCIPLVCTAPPAPHAPAPAVPSLPALPPLPLPGG